MHAKKSKKNKNRSKKSKNKRNRTYKRIKGGLEPISALGITTAAAKIHSLHLLNVYHLIALHGAGGNMISMHLFLHKALIKNIAHISSECRPHWDPSTDRSECVTLPASDQILLDP